MRILYARPSSAAWNVITVMVRLAARLLEAELIEVPAARSRTAAARLAGLLPRRRGEEDLLIIAPEPVDLQNIIRLDHWLVGYQSVAAWVIDSWWDDRIPHVARQRRHFDLIYVTELENLDVWSRATGTDVRWLPQGTNAVDWGSCRTVRELDLLRVGRQPAEWSEDNTTEELCQRHNLRFGGRPPFHDDPEVAMGDLMRTMSSSKFVLAFGNRHSPSYYTHPTMEYLTGRWTDSLASGATVAGVAPATESVARLLWPEATIDLGTTDPEVGIRKIQVAAAAWDPATARLNHLRALERLDWRWRIAQIADDLGRATPTLTIEMERLRSRIGWLTGSGSG